MGSEVRFLGNADVANHELVLLHQPEPTSIADHVLSVIEA